MRGLALGVEIKEIKQVQKMNLISFLPIFLDSQLINKGFWWEKNLLSFYQLGLLKGVFNKS